MQNTIKVPKQLQKKFGVGAQRLGSNLELLYGFIDSNNKLIESFDKYQDIGDNYNYADGEHYEEYMEKLEWFKGQFYHHVILKALGYGKKFKPETSAEYKELFEEACRHKMTDSIYEAVVNKDKSYWDANNNKELIREIILVDKLPRQIIKPYSMFLEFAVAGRGELETKEGFDMYRKKLYQTDDVFKDVVDGMGFEVNKSNRDYYREAHEDAQKALEKLPELAKKAGGF